jgi:hypothetical protein
MKNNPLQDIALIIHLTNELHAATAYIVEHGKIEIGTPQSRRMIEAVQAAKQYGISPRVPDNYPMAARLIEKSNDAEANAEAEEETGI